MQTEQKPKMISASALARKIDMPFPRLSKAISSGAVLPDEIMPGLRQLILFREDRAMAIWQKLQK